MPYEGEPDLEDLALQTARLSLALIDGSDAPEAFLLLTHDRLQHLDPKSTPKSEGAYEEFGRRVRDRADNDGSYRIYVWAVRDTMTRELAALVTAEFTLDVQLNTDGPPTELRTIEMTAYVHPDRQGRGYGPEACDAIRAFAVGHLDVTQRRALIRWDNTRSQDLTRASGMTLRDESMTPQGYQTWLGTT